MSSCLYECICDKFNLLFSLCQSLATVQSLGENATTPVSVPSTVSNQSPQQLRTDKPGLSVAAQVESYGS